MTRCRAVRIPLSGGFGNQLFQIIFALYLRQELAVPLLIEGRRATARPEHQDSSLSNLDWAGMGIGFSRSTPLPHLLIGAISVLRHGVARHFPQPFQRSLKQFSRLLGLIEEDTSDPKSISMGDLKNTPRITGYFQDSFYFSSLDDTSVQALRAALKKLSEEDLNHL